MLLPLTATDPQATTDLANEVMHQFQKLGFPGRRPGAALLDSLAK
jgi:hypothetical protein